MRRAGAALVLGSAVLALGCATGSGDEWRRAERFAETARDRARDPVSRVLAIGALGNRRDPVFESVIAAVLASPEEPLMLRHAAGVALARTATSGERMSALVASGDAIARLAALQGTGGVDPFRAELERALRDPKSRDYALAIVVAMGERAKRFVPALEHELGAGGDFSERVARALGELGPVAEESLPAIREAALRGLDPAIAAAAIRAIQADPGEAVLFLASSLRATGGDDPSRDVALACAEVARIGPPARAAVPALVELLARRDGPSSARALGWIDSDDAAPALAGMLRMQLQRTWIERHLPGSPRADEPAFAEALGRIRAPDADATASLAEASECELRAIRERARWALGKADAATARRFELEDVFGPQEYVRRVEKRQGYEVRAFVVHGADLALVPSGNPVVTYANGWLRRDLPARFEPGRRYVYAILVPTERAGGRVYTCTIRVRSGPLKGAVIHVRDGRLPPERLAPYQAYFPLPTGWDVPTGELSVGITKWFMK